MYGLGDLHDLTLLISSDLLSQRGMTPGSMRPSASPLTSPGDQSFTWERSVYIRCFAASLRESLPNPASCRFEG